MMNVFAERQHRARRVNMWMQTMKKKKKKKEKQQDGVRRTTTTERRKGGGVAASVSVHLGSAVC